ncbi:hypothetical protein BRC79_06015 [Halobacteriales archaeon QH_8_67_27]|nr:MAG: hypothetical protein BRC79_06015 [Halobacteriales archaeon QH_8_67_27]
MKSRFRVSDEPEYVGRCETIYSNPYDTVLGGEGGVDDKAERVRDLTRGGAEHVLECVGTTSAMETAVAARRPSGTVGYVGVPHGMGDGLDLFDFFGDNITLAGGVAPVYAYADDLLADVLGGTLDPSPIFTKTVSLDDVAEGYRAMDEREAVKVLVKP